MTDLSALMIYSEEKLDPATLAEIQEELRALDGVQSTGGQTRSIDPASLDLWVKLAASAISTVGTAVPVLTAIVKVLRKRGVRNTTIELKDGTKIVVENATADDIRRIVETTQA
jgi:hypothetical protein